ncbi:MAG: hypothetical protein R2682_02310 [Pyrinomonadaceae bacterium]
MFDAQKRPISVVLSFLLFWAMFFVINLTTDFAIELVLAWGQSSISDFVFGYIANDLHLFRRLVSVFVICLPMFLLLRRLSRKQE